METRPRSQEVESEAVAGSPTTDVTVCEAAPGTRVFIESDNTDGWIATDSVVEIHR